MSTFVVDTHALVWFLARDQRLSEKAHTILRDPTARLIIPAIVLAEIKYLGNKGRFSQTLDRTTQHWYTAALFESLPPPDHELVGLQYSAG